MAQPLPCNMKAAQPHLPVKWELVEYLGDATQGALYNYYGELWISFDYGENWEYKETYGSGRFTSGCINGEIYKCCVNVEGSIWRSENYGSNFIEMTDDVKYALEVGNSEGNVFGFGGLPGLWFDLLFSNNYAVLFDTIPIDSTVAYWAPSGQYPQISRGTQSGELYLVSWWLEPNYKIFHSTDTGYTWTEKYESEYIDLYFWRVHYTAGREPGSFYVMRSRINPAGDHVWLYIDYSNDYGQTFTTYFHDLDSTLTSTESPEFNNIELFNYPNPFTDRTRISIASDKNLKDAYILICDVLGRQIQKIALKDKNSFIWDATDSNGKKVRNGLYFYSLIAGNTLISSNKLLINR